MKLTKKKIAIGLGLAAIAFYLYKKKAGGTSIASPPMNMGDHLLAHAQNKGEIMTMGLSRNYDMMG